MKSMLMAVSISLSLFVAFMTHGQGLLASTIPVFDASSDAALIDFDTDDMAFHPEKATFRVEGYWATSGDTANDHYSGRFPFPKAYAEKWLGQEEFLRRLSAIEADVRVDTYRGMASSRLEEGAFVGNSEFVDEEAKIIWPAGYREHYVEKFNVKPSREFYRYVMKFGSTQVLHE